MADLKSEFLGISSPNPFWLASAPPTDKAYNVNRAFEAGWGGAVWIFPFHSSPKLLQADCVACGLDMPVPYFIVCFLEHAEIHR